MGKIRGFLVGAFIGAPLVYLALVLLLSLGGCSPIPVIYTEPVQTEIICTEIGDNTYCRQRG